MVAWKIGNGFTSIAFLLGVPIATPALATLIWDRRGERRISEYIQFALLVISLILLSGIVALREGGVCLVMAAPLFYLGGIGGTILMGYLLRRRNTRVMSVALIAFPLLAMPIEQRIVYPAQSEVVTSSVDVDASPSMVWRNVTSVPNIRSGELGWTFTQDVVGVPKPVDARMEGTGIGAVRHARWGEGVHFDERIVRWREDRDLVWSFQFFKDSIPNELEGHIRVRSSYLNIEQGAYHLTPLPHGRTHLVLETRYTMRTPLNRYCALWGRVFIGDFHANILRVVRERSERMKTLALKR